VCHDCRPAGNGQFQGGAPRPDTPGASTRRVRSIGGLSPFTSQRSGGQDHVEAASNKGLRPLSPRPPSCRSKLRGSSEAATLRGLLSQLPWFRSQPPPPEIPGTPTRQLCANWPFLRILAQPSKQCGAKSSATRASATLGRCQSHYWQSATPRTRPGSPGRHKEWCGSCVSRVPNSILLRHEPSVFHRSLIVAGSFVGDLGSFTFSFGARS